MNPEADNQNINSELVNNSTQDSVRVTESIKRPVSQPGIAEQTTKSGFSGSPHFKSKRMVIYISLVSIFIVGGCLAVFFATQGNFKNWFVKNESTVTTDNDSNIDAMSGQTTNLIEQAESKIVQRPTYTRVSKIEASLDNIPLGTTVKFNIPMIRDYYKWAVALDTVTAIKNPDINSNEYFYLSYSNRDPFKNEMELDKNINFTIKGKSGEKIGSGRLQIDGTAAVAFVTGFDFIGSDTAKEKATSDLNNDTFGNFKGYERYDLDNDVSCLFPTEKSEFTIFTNATCYIIKKQTLTPWANAGLYYEITLHLDPEYEEKIDHRLFKTEMIKFYDTYIKGQIKEVKF